MGGGGGATMAAEMIQNYAWSSHTHSTRKYQWGKWIEFCAADDRVQIPVTEAHFTAFVGWLELKCKAG